MTTSGDALERCLAKPTALSAVPWLRRGLTLAAAAYLAALLALAWVRLPYPYELEWMEGAMADHVARLVDGKPLYAPPSLEFTSFTYTPLYFHLCALASRCCGQGLLPLRAVAFLASLGTLLVIFLFVARETGSRRLGFWSAGFFAATYRLSGAWLDVARPDSLFLLLALTAIYLLRFHPSVWGLVAASVLLVLSFLAKQTALLVALPLAAYGVVCLRGWRRFLLPVLVAAGLVLTTWWANRQTGGWYAYYVFAVPRAHGIVPYRLASFWVFDMAPLFLACFGAAALVCRFAAERRSADLTFFAALAIGLVGAAWAVRLRDGSYTNTLLPACAGLALCFGPALRRLVPDGALDAPAADSAPWVSALLTTALAQFAVLAYNPLPQIPSAADRGAGAEFVAGLRSLPGEVYVPGHGYLPRLAGKKPSAHHVAVTDVLREREGRLPNPLAEEIHRAFLTGRFGAVVLDDPAWLPEELLLRYDDRGPVFDAPDAFWPVTGRRIRPDRLYIRRDGP